MAQFTHSTSTVETVGDLRKRVAELERECKRLRGYPDRDAAICRAEAGNVDHSSRLAQTKPLANLGHCERSSDTDQWLSCSEGLRRLLDVDAGHRPSAKCLMRAVYPDDRRRYRDATKRHRQAGQPYEIEYRIKRSDGAIIDVREVSEPLLSSNGSVTRWLSCMQDVSRGSRERHLQRDEEPYRDLVLGAMEGIGVVRGDKVLFANQALADIFGYDNPEQLRAIGSTDILIAPHERARIKRHRDARLRGDPAPARYCAQYRRKDGEPIWLESIVRVVDWAGGPATQATLVDITQQVAAEKALKASEQRFKDFAEASSDWFWEMGPDLRFTWFSVESPFLGTTREEAGWPDYDPEAWRRHQADLKARRPFKNFCYRQALDDKEVYVNVSGVPIFADDGNFLGYRGTGTDVSARIRAEREVAKARAMLNDAVESVSEGFAMFDKDDRLVLSNEGYRSLLAAVWDGLEPKPTWPALFQRMVERGVIKSPEAELEAWIRGQNEAHRAGPSVRRHETGDGRFVEIRTYPTRGGGFAVVRSEITALKRAEEALRDSEQRFRDFANASSDGFWEMGPDLRFTWFSSKILEGSGFRSADLLGKAPWEIAPRSPEPEELRQHRADLEAHRAFKDYRHTVPLENSVLHLSVSGIPLFAGDGRFMGYRGTETDITAQVRAEQEAARAHALMTDAMEGIGGGVVVYDRDDRIVMVNQNALRALPEFADVLRPGTTWGTVVRTQLERGWFRVPDSQRETWMQEQTAVHRHGGIRYYHTRNGEWIELRDHRTQDGGCVSVQSNITELKRAEEALKTSEQRFKDFAEASSDWFWEMGPDLRFTWFSHQNPGDTGASAHDLIGQPRHLGGPSKADREQQRAHIADLQAHRPFKDFRYRVVHAPGEEFYLSVSGVPVFDADSRFLGYRGTGKNITVEVHAELRAARAQDTLTDAIESIREGFAMYDRQDRLVLCNANYRKSLEPIWDGLGANMRWQSMFRATAEHGLVKAPKKGREAWLRQQIKTHRTTDSARQLECADGRWIEIREYPTRDGGFATVKADITTLKRAEDALRVSERRFRDFAEASSDWFWEMGPDLRFSWFSDGASAAIGKTRPENSGDPADTPAWRDHLADLEARRPFKDFRYTGRDQHGTEICASVSGVPIFDTEGAFLGYRGTATDITAEVRAEQRAAQAQAMLVDAIESIADGFSMFDRDDRLILVNQHHRRALAAIADLAVPGVQWETLLRAQVDRGLVKVPVEDRETWIQEQLAEHRRGDAVRVHETLDGRWVEIRDYRTRDGGWAIVRADITALKRAEAARKESEQRFKDFAEATSDWFWEMGPDLRFTWFSHRLLKGTGLYTRKLIGKTRRMLGRSDTDARKWRAHIAKLNARRPFRDFRYRIRNDAGKDVFLSISGVPLFGPDNIFVGYRGTGKNITAEVLAEQRAAQAQAFLTDAIESIREGFAMFDKQDRLVLSNESFRKSLSAIADVLRPGMPWKTGFLAMVKRGVVKVPTKDREAWIAKQISMHRKPGCVRTMETASGHWRDVREYPTRDGGLVLIRADITEIKLAEMAIGESEALLKQATQMANLGHWVWDEQQDRCIHCSEGLSRMYGLTPDEYIAELGTHKTTTETVIEEDRERYDDVIRRALKLKKGYDIEFRERLADGSIRHMRERGDPVLNDAGALVRTVGIVQDITKHKRAEEAIRHARDELEMRVEERTTALRKANLALKNEIAGHKRTEAARRESRGLLEAIIEASVMGINVKGPDHRYVFMNAYQADVYGVRPEDAVGKTPTELIGAEYGEHLAPFDRRVIETGATIPYFEEEIPDKDGVLRTWLTTKIPVNDSDGALRYIVSTSLDITEVKARERVLKQAQKMEAVGKLTGGIAHDFNNLLFVIRGNVALLTDELGDSSAARECLGAIQDAAKLGADLTRSLLAFSRQQPLEPAVVHLPEVIAPTVATLLRPLEKNIQIETSYPQHVWPVLIDRHQIENALLNLALNARDAMPDGGHLRISVENRRSSNGHARRSYYMLPGDYVCLVVADTGVGMPPDVIEHAFEPFFTTKPAGSGTGLGLSMVYGFIKQSGGYIDIDSKLGQGTTITMHLPRTSRPEDKRPAPADHRRWLAKGKETILVTEDDAAVRRVAVRILTKLGYTTREASNGAEALEILERDPSIDLLFADIVLSGGLNGAQLAREAQARLPKLKLLFASGYSQPAVLRETEGAGSIPLLSKPYDAEELGKLIRRLLDGAGKPRSR